MTAFTTTLTQTASLLIFIALGYMLGKLRLVLNNTHSALSKLETNLFVPALVLNIFISNFTTDKLTVAWQLLLCSCDAYYKDGGLTRMVGTENESLFDLFLVDKDRKTVQVFRVGAGNDRTFSY
jgi:hypothetical protein